MKKILSFILVLVSFGSFAQPKEKDIELKEQASIIKNELSLDDKAEHLIYNVLYHIKTRIADIPLGHQNYQKLLAYVDDERVSMMKALLPANKYKKYDTVFGPTEKQKIASILAKNDEHVKNHGVLVSKVTAADADDKFVAEDENSESEPASPANTETTENK
jgi:hypothetical protein